VRMVDRVCNYATVSKAKEENAKMGFAKRLKFWKRAENHKTGVIRGKVCFSPLGLLRIM